MPQYLQNALSNKVIKHLQTQLGKLGNK